FRFGGQYLGLGHPGIGPARKANFFTDLVGGIVIEFGKLPVMENAEIVELPFDSARYAGELLEIVGRAARASEALEAGCGRGGRDFFACRMCGGSDIDARFAL